MNPRSFTFPNPTYPGSTEVLLAVFMFLHIPLNLFNVLAWATLFLMLERLGRRAGLNEVFAAMFALAICILPTVVRLVHTQTADLWLDMFFVSALLLLMAPRDNWWYFAKLGLALGMVAGAKFSGPLFCIVAIAVYIPDIWKRRSIINAVALALPFLLTGLSWYIRNMIVYGNPVYPSPALFFKGVEGFSRYMQTHAVTLMSSTNGFKQTIDAWISEYVSWCMLAVIGPLMLIIAITKRIFRGAAGLLAVGTGSLAVYLIVPGYPFAYQNIVSEVRYGHPAMIAFILAAFVIVHRWKGSALVLTTLTVCPLAFLLPGPYMPKLVALIAWGMVAVGVLISRHIRVLK